MRAVVWPEISAEVVNKALVCFRHSKTLSASFRQDLEFRHQIKNTSIDLVYQPRESDLICRFGEKMWSYAMKTVPWNRKELEVIWR